MSRAAGSRALPPVDERLVASESRYEIVDGKVVFVAPADEPHGTRHSKVSAIVEAHASDSYDVASDMLTRLTEIDDMAPDVSVFPIARDAATGGRLIEELAFEVVSTQRLAHAGEKAAKLVARGVRRVFAIDVERRRALEWSSELAGWSILADGASIEDKALAVPLPVAALVRAATADNALARALLAKKNPVLEEEGVQREARGEARGKAAKQLEGVLIILALRGMVPTEEEHARLVERAAHSDRLLIDASTCGTIRALLESNDGAR